MDRIDAELAVKKNEKSNIHHDTGLSWLLIILMLILLAVSVNVFDHNSGDGAGVVSPTPSPSLMAAEDTPPPRLYSVSYRAGVFSPTNLRIHSGDTVRFRNDGSVSIHVVSDPHPTHDDLLGFDSTGDVPTGSFFTFTFAAKGTFGYHNERSTDEKGTIIVR